MNTPQYIMEKIVEDRGRFTSELLSLMGMKVTKQKVNDLLNCLDAYITLEEALGIINVSSVMSFICWSSGYGMCTQLFCEINKLLTRDMTIMPKDLVRSSTLANAFGVDCSPMSEFHLRNIYSPNGYTHPDDKLRMFAQCIIFTIYYEPFAKYSLATAVLGITYLMVWNGVGYCSMSANSVRNIIRYLQDNNSEGAEDYIMSVCFKLFD